MEYTLHALVRSAQRGVPLEIVDVIYSYGHQERAPGQAVRLSLDSEAIWLACEDMPWLRGKLERYSNIYLVLNDDQKLITVARRNTRFFH